jgi:AcrR family transcriptional regulator
MPTPRRVGTARSKTRAALLDAAEQLMLHEGYAAVTSRRVAERADVKPGLVHYYFPTMDDLFIALLHRQGEQGLERQARALEAEQPLWSLWELVRGEPNAAMTVEMLALANHRKALRAEIASHAERLRNAQIRALSSRIGQYGLGRKRSAAVTVMVLMAAISRLLAMERALGISAGHAETIALVERYLSGFEGRRKRPGRARARRRRGA